MDKAARMKEAMELRAKLFDIANEFAVEKDGDVAVLLHAACNDILRASDKFEGKLSEGCVRRLEMQEVFNCSALARMLNGGEND